eukprot:CAMPEP_0183734052 /NCGR_PEP_ID=MMETSP0737-20130205/42760_1 /TAXON_ID=385413 /ORGANISM="Thalassiosira miniscula, Strain CCMP1093" /LENGTH=707 /DNA_ID=CAMNT_0025967445 /DNA_START=139 /DNA_END=2258 /DNA_ORIENTATION=-
MLDLLVFASAIAIAKYISRKNPLLSSTSSSSPSADDDKNNKNNKNANDNPIQRQTRYIFRATLLICLVLFSLGILETAPTSWLIVFDNASTFVHWYRISLCALCVLLLVIHPAYLGVIVGASIFGTSALSSCSSSNGSAPVPPSPRRSSLENGGGRRGSSGGFSGNSSRHYALLMKTLKIGKKILWIAFRCVFISVISVAWRLVRMIVGTIIPYRITRVSGASRSRATRNREPIQFSMLAIMMIAFIFLCLSFVWLASVGSLVLNFGSAENSGTQNGILTVDGEDLGAPHDVKQYTLLDYIHLRFMVSVLCAVGMIVASILNGFGCASLPHSNLVGVFLKPTSPMVVAKVEDDFHYTLKRLEDKRRGLADIMEGTAFSAGTSIMASFTPSKNKQSADSQRIHQLQEEVLFLENLAGDMNDDIEEMKQSQQLALAARTTPGRVKGVLGVVFSVVLVVRVILAANAFLSLWNTSTTKSNSSDPLTTISLWLVGRNIVKTQEQYDLFRQGTSLILAGFLSASQVRAFFRVVSALGRRLSRAVGVSFGRMAPCIPSSLPPSSSTPSKSTVAGKSTRTGHGNAIALLLSSFIMGCYFLACVTVVKMTLPVEYRSSFSTAVGLNFSFNTRLLNMIFFASACISASVLASLFGIQRNNSERYQLETQQSSLQQLETQLASPSPAAVPDPPQHPNARELSSASPSGQDPPAFSQR